VHDPGERELSGADALFLGDLADSTDELEVALEVLALKSREPTSGVPSSRSSRLVIRPLRKPRQSGL